MSPPALKKKLSPSEDRNGMCCTVCASGAPSHELIFYKCECRVEMDTISVEERMCCVCDLWARSGYIMCEILL